MRLPWQQKGGQVMPNEDRSPDGPPLDVPGQNQPLPETGNPGNPAPASPTPVGNPAPVGNPHPVGNPAPTGNPAPADPPAPAAEDPVTMEARVSSRGGTPISGKKCGRWTLDQLRVTDGICILQNGTNKYDSQKGMVGFGTIRNTTQSGKWRVISDNLEEIPEEIALLTNAEVRLQSGTNKFDSQKGMVGFGTGRDVVRESYGVNRNPADLTELPEEKILLSEGFVRLQSGTNKFASQKRMMAFGTNRRETTKMIDTKHPEYNHEVNIDSSIIRLQAGTNKFDSQKGYTSFGTNRRELTKMKYSKIPEPFVDHPDQSIIGGQMGSNQYASQVGMTCFGQGRWPGPCAPRVPGLHRQVQIGQGLVPYQMGSNIYASQKGFVAFGTGRDVCRESAFEGEPIPFEEYQKSQDYIRYQAGWNKGDSQKGYTSFGAPRDVKGKHIKRIWELEFPDLDFVSAIQ